MAISMKVYSPFVNALGQKTVDIDSDTYKIMLVTSGYTFDQDNHDFKNDVTAELANGAGYSTGGITLTSVAWTYNASTNTWTFDANDVSWASATFTGVTGAVIYNDTPATAATKPLVAYIDFGGAVNAGGGPFDIQFAIGGIFTVVVA